MFTFSETLHDFIFIDYSTTVFCIVLLIVFDRNILLNFNVHEMGNKQKPNITEGSCPDKLCHYL